MKASHCGKSQSGKKFFPTPLVKQGLVLTLRLIIRMPPGQNMDDWWTMLRSGMWKLYFKLSKEGRKRWFKEFLPKLHDTK